MTYKIQRSLYLHLQICAKDIQGGIASGSGIVAEVEANALAEASANDLMSLPTRDGRRLISYHFFHDENGKEKVKGMDKSMSVFLQAMIKKYALPSRVKKRSSPYFTDFEVFKSIRNDYENKKYDERNMDKKTAGKRMQMLIKDYLNGIERILKKHAKGVQEALTGYLKRKSTDRRWLGRDNSR